MFNCGEKAITSPAVRSVLSPRVFSLPLVRTIGKTMVQGKNYGPQITVKRIAGSGWVASLYHVSKIFPKFGKYLVTYCYLYLFYMIYWHYSSPANLLQANTRSSLKEHLYFIFYNYTRVHFSWLLLMLSSSGWVFEISCSHYVLCCGIWQRQSSQHLDTPGQSKSSPQSSGFRAHENCPGPVLPTPAGQFPTFQPSKNTKKLCFVYLPLGRAVDSAVLCCTQIFCTTNRSAHLFDGLREWLTAESALWVESSFCIIRGCWWAQL